MLSLRKGRYAARAARSENDIAAVQNLRQGRFRRGAAPDLDAFDEQCHHILVEEIKTGVSVCCFRLLPLTSGAQIDMSYSSQYYDLERLSGFDGVMAEMGRFCIHPDYTDPDILRVAWGR